MSDCYLSDEENSSLNVTELSHISIISSGSESDPDHSDNESSPCDAVMLDITNDDDTIITSSIISTTATTPSARKKFTFRETPLFLATKKRMLAEQQSTTVSTRTPASASSSQNGRFAYLVTYAQADLLKCESREKFASMVVNEFNWRDDDVVAEWACAVENHQRHGVHYHLSIKLKKRRRFVGVRNNILKKIQINVVLHM